MAAPTFVAEYEVSSWGSSTTPKTVSTTVAAGDLLVVAGATEDTGNTLNDPTGGSLTYTLRQSVTVASYSGAWGWTAAPGGSQTYTLSDDKNADIGGWWGFTALRFSGTDGYGTSTKTNVSSGAPSLSITPTQDNSAIVVIVTDWNATDGASRTWRTVNGITPTSGNGLERVYFRDSAHFAVYVAYYSDVGTAGVAKTVGLSAPSGQKYAIIAIEVKGSGSTNATVTPGAINATTSVPAPSLSTGQTVSATAIQLTASVPAVTVTAVTTVSPAAIQATTSVPAPSISTGSTVSAVAIAGTTTMPAPALSTGETVSAVAISATTSVPAVSVSTGGSATVPASAVQVTTSVPAVSVSTGQTVTAVAITAVVSLPAPAVSGGATFVAVAVTAVTSLPAPAVSTGQTVAATAVQLTTSVPAPSVGAGAGVTPAAVLALASFPTAGVSGGATVVPVAIAVVVSLPAPAVSANLDAAITPTAILAVVSLPSVTVTVLEAPPVTSVPGTGGWLQLLAILRERALTSRADVEDPFDIHLHEPRLRSAPSLTAPAFARPSACPEDGVPLQVGPNGELYCPFDGWQYGGTTTEY